MKICLNKNSQLFVAGKWKCSTPKRDNQRGPSAHQSPILTKDMKNISEDTLIDIENVSVSISNTGNVTILNSDSEIDCTDDDSICSTLSGDSASLEMTANGMDC